jgi:hypothetical protein
LLGPTIPTGLFKTDRDGSVVSWIQEETSVSADLKGDGDTIDCVLRIYEPSEDRVHSIDRAVRGFNPHEHEVESGNSAFPYPNRQTDPRIGMLTETRTTSFCTWLSGIFHPPGMSAREILGEASSGRALGIQLRRARPLSAEALVIGTAADTQPIFAGTRFFQAPLLSQVMLAMRPLGFGGIARVILSPIPPELSCSIPYMQAGVVDPDAPGGVALTRGLRLRIGG